MYKAVFQNSKIALLFAGMTIIGAVSMVGSSEDEGILNKAVDRFGQEREAIADDAREFAEAQSVPDKVSDPAAGWGSSEPSVFSDYQPGDATASNGSTSNPQPSRIKPGRQPGAFVPGPQPVVSDNVSLPAPGDPALATSPAAVPVITSRKMTLEPN
jgi:hypothetical protein